MDNKKLAEYKEKYGSIFKGRYSFTDFKKEIHELTFHFRRPNNQDVDRYQNTMQKNVTVANRNLICDLVIDQEERNKIIELEKEYPAIALKIIETFSPFLGISGESTVEEA
ncbi:MAG: hypothetical protein JXB50_12280 [Spirochaetes bacterium]|nr:hypothetical protein [Spirochaetota bacterium]